MVMSRFVGEILVDRDAVKPGTHVIHQTYGAGVIKEVTDKAIIIQFDKVRQEKKLDKILRMLSIVTLLDFRSV